MKISPGDTASQPKPCVAHEAAESPACRSLSSRRTAGRGGARKRALHALDLPPDHRRVVNVERRAEARCEVSAEMLPMWRDVVDEGEHASARSIGAAPQR